MHIEHAFAKVNLSLLLTGRVDNNYHALSSFVVFTEFGDEVHLEKASTFSFHMTGPFANGLEADDSNLCVKAYHFMNPPYPVKITLIKNIPLASGIGGGSADAAAVIRGLMHLYDLTAPTTQQLLTLGADVPVCFRSKPCHMSGIGEELTDMSLPCLHLVLVNPRVAVPTAEIFKANNIVSFSHPCTVFPAALSELRNDLEKPATTLFPVIKDVLSFLKKDQNCQLARMSGSGGTCFGVYPDAASAKLAEKRIKEKRPTWWATTTRTTKS